MRSDGLDFSLYAELPLEKLRSYGGRFLRVGAFGCHDDGDRVSSYPIRLRQ